MIIFLIGMPACGKTSMGKRLAKKTKFTLIDLDKYLSAKENTSVTKIFEEKGETFFRELESKYLQEISNTTAKNIIVSVGGGTPCFHNNINHMLSTGHVVYLNTPVETIFLRVKKKDSKRPLFSNLPDDQLKEKINSLVQQREPFYAQAHHNVHTANKSDEAIMGEIIKKLPHSS